MISRVSEIIRGWLGWCPNSRMLKVQYPRDGRATRTADSPDVPQPDDAPETGAGSPDWFAAAAIAILFATLFFGGLVWWPFFVLAVLAAGLAYRHLRARRSIHSVQE